MKAFSSNRLMRFVAKKTYWMLLGAMVLALALVTVPASAGTVSYVTSTPIPSTLTDWGTPTPLPLTFQQFNPGMGTLTSVEIQLQEGLSTQITVTNDSPDASSGTVNTHVAITVQDVGGHLVTPDNLYSPSYGYSLSSSASTTSGTLTQTGSSDTVYFSPAVLLEFTGAGTYSLNASTFTETLLANTGGNTAAGQVTDAQLTGTVIYNYTPEPATLALLVLGGLGVLRRRRR